MLTYIAIAVVVGIALIIGALYYFKKPAAPAETPAEPVVPPGKKEEDTGKNQERQLQ